LWESILKKALKVGLVKGRHDMPVDEYVFDNIPEDSLKNQLPMLKNYAEEWLEGREGELHLYVTGFTPALTAFLKAWGNRGKLLLFHYDRDIDDYVSEEF
jgi:hypothetical protein